MEKITETLELERETKRTYRYKATLDEAVKPSAIGTLYVQKWATGNPPPQKVRLTVEPLEKSAP